MPVVSNLSIPLQAPLLSVCAVEAILYCNAEKISKLVDEGALLFAFDIRHPDAGKIRLRVLAQSVADYVTKKPVSERQQDLDAVIETIIPSSKNLVSGTSVARMLNCDADHANRLIKGGALKPDRRRCHSNQSHQISRDTIVAFLKQRRVF